MKIDAKQNPRFNLYLALTILGVIAIVGARLFVQASSDGNWRGLYLSLAHVIIVGIGTYYGVHLTVRPEK